MLNQNTNVTKNVVQSAVNVVDKTKFFSWVIYISVSLSY